MRLQSTDPVVSVVMAVHNAVRYVRAAIESILAQTYADFEMIVVDDASSDGTAEILRAVDDPRVRVWRNDANIGQTASLVRATSVARGRYIAIMDGDDVSEANRLAEQVHYLEGNPSCSVVGAATFHINGAGTHVGRCAPYSRWDDIRFNLISNNFVDHSSLVFRSEFFRQIGGYNEEFRFAQDYEILTRVVMNGGRIDIITTPLLRYRIHDGQVSTAKRAEQAECARKIALRYASWLTGMEVSTAARRVFMGDVSGWHPTSCDIRDAIAVMNRACRACSTCLADSREAMRHLAYRRSLRCASILSAASPLHAFLFLGNAAMHGRFRVLNRQVLRLLMRLGKQSITQLIGRIKVPQRRYSG